MLRVLLVADTHLGYDWTRRPRSDRPRRGADFFANFESALAPAHHAAADIVVHAGDLLYRSKVPAALVRLALEPLLRVADRGVPVFLVPGNHERSTLPYPLFGLHEHLHVFHRPGTVRVQVRGVEVAVVGVPCQRDGAAAQFACLVAAADDGAPADVRLLAIHQAVAGAAVGPADFVFRGGDDVVPASAIPSGFAAVLSGHVHRHQVLTRDLSGRPLAAPVLYAGSIERTSFAERHEAKGYLTLEVAPDAATGGRLRSWRFHDLPARPMVTLRIAPKHLSGAALEAILAEGLAGVPRGAVVRVEVEGALPRGLAAALRSAVRSGCARHGLIVDLVRAGGLTGPD